MYTKANLVPRLYKSMLQVLLLLCVVSSQKLPVPASAEEFMPICDPQEYEYNSDDPPLPDLPKQFSLTVEGNLVERNSTAIMTEYYDGPGNRGRLEFKHNDKSGIGIFDYNLEEVFFIHHHESGVKCRVYPLATHPPRFINRTFGVVHGDNGTIHIDSPRVFFEKLRENDTTQYLGEDFTVRGIPAQRWQACFNRENNSYLIDYYFAAEDWNYDGQGQKLDLIHQQVPLQFTLNVTRIDHHGHLRNIYHIYSVIDFHAGPDSVPDSLFRVPNGLACRGRFPGQPVPQIPQFFSTYVQRAHRNFNRTHIYRVRFYRWQRYT